MLKREERLHAALHEALTMNDDLLAILENVEWHQQRYNGSPACPNCGAQQHWGHEKGCELASAIGVAVDRCEPKPLSHADDARKDASK